MKLRYYADSSYQEDHEAVLDRLRRVHRTHDVTVEVHRVRERHGPLGEVPGAVTETSVEDAYERDFEYNHDLAENTGHAPSSAYTTKSGLVTIAGCVAVVEGGPKWATMLSGEAPDVDDAAAHAYTVTFLDAVLDRGPVLMKKKCRAAHHRDDDVAAEFVSSGAVDFEDGRVLRNETVGARSAVSPEMSAGARSVARDVGTRTVDVLVETDRDWVIEVREEFTPTDFDDAVGEVLVADELYRDDRGLALEQTTRAVVFGQFPGGLDLSNEVGMLSTLVDCARRLDVEVFVGTRREGLAPRRRQFDCLTDSVDGAEPATVDVEEPATFDGTLEIDPEEPDLAVDPAELIDEEPPRPDLAGLGELIVGEELSAAAEETATDGGAATGGGRPPEEPEGGED
jgi:hypothetical protein